jgi:hypothetical protein
VLAVALGALEEPDRGERGLENRQDPRIGTRHRRHDWVQEAVITVLEHQAEPMHARDVHAAAEALLGEPVHWGSVKACLAANAAGSSRRFVRVAPGRYAMGVSPTDPGATARPQGA